MSRPATGRPLRQKAFMSKAAANYPLIPAKCRNFFAPAVDKSDFMIHNYSFESCPDKAPIGVETARNSIQQGAHWR
ncbi:hypothetical protein J2T60_002623 [Natronospira proteinivora]|uniref:Uncharacterized protein n=1 Tax=Natronospira proteinivora TaxID=1807133 RepID=A0ABT1GBB3_9GAMM|nr:hypothetical protein [Natronospira proteinivora]MCP1728609.1 hypothetical protein [Natronospira proteinivora]